MSTYGATSAFPPPLGAEVVGGAVVGLVGGVLVGFVAGAVVGAVVGVLVGAVVGAVVTVPPPPVQEAPLIVQLVGAPLPATMKPKVALAPGAIVVA
jgi:hypothetical protein